VWVLTKITKGMNTKLYFENVSFVTMQLEKDC